MVSEIGFSDMLNLAQTIGIVGTMVLTSDFDSLHRDDIIAAFSLESFATLS